MKILVVDDEPDVQIIFEQNFYFEKSRKELDLTYALSGEEALKLLAEDEPTEITLILSDINMPGMNGLELLRIIKERFPGMTVFMITAYSDEEKLNMAREYGCDGYLTKPLDFDMLKEKILK